MGNNIEGSGNCKTGRDKLGNEGIKRRGKSIEGAFTVTLGNKSSRIGGM